MYIYLLVLIISCTFGFFADKNFKNKQDKKGLLYLVLSIIPLVLLAGLRSVHLGFDVELYGIRIFNKVSNMTVAELINSLAKETLESGFVFVVYILSKFVNDIHFVLFGLQLLISISFVGFAYHYRNNASIPVMIVVYFCTLYIRSYDLLRQGLAIASIMQMIVFIDKKKKILPIIFFLLALTFHNSAIFSIIIPIIIYICNTKKLKSSSKNIINVSLLLLFVAIVFNYDNIIHILSSIGILNSKYLYYVDENSSFMYSKIDIRWSITIIKTIMIMLGILYINNKKITLEEREKNKKWLIFLLYDYVINFLTFKVRNFDRIALYFYYPATMIFVPQLSKCVKNDKFNKTVIQAFIVVLFLTDFIEKMITNRYELNPYVSMFFDY